MTTPVKVFGDYVVCFEAEPEYEPMRSHFIKSCGWTASQYRSIAKFAWFCARVSIWKSGKELACTYLGTCCYKTSEEFYTVYEGDYFADMVRECAEEVGDPDLLAMVYGWLTGFREEVTA